MSWESFQVQLPATVVLAPVVVALLCMVVGWWRRELCQRLAVLALAFTAACSVGLLLRVLDHPDGVIHYWMGGWQPAPAVEGGVAMPFGIELVVDRLSALLVVVTSFCGLLSVIYARVTIAEEFGEKEPHFYCLLLLFLTGMLGILLTGDAFNLYVLIEIASITCYALIAMGKGPAPVAAFQYVLMGAVGASLYLLGIGYLYALTGTLNMADMAVRLELVEETQQPLVFVSFLFCLIGLGLKMAIFPLHWWVPNAYATAPDAVSTLLAPVFTKVSVYALIRLLLSVYTVQILTTAHLGGILVSFASVGVVYGAVMAVRQVELKRSFAYILVAEMCYFAGGLGVQNADGFLGALYHITGDACLMLCLFAVAGTIAYKQHDYLASSLAGLFRRLPSTGWSLVLAALAVIGVPPTCGFFAKVFLVRGAIEAGRWDFVLALLIASILMAMLFFRLFEKARAGEPSKPPPPPPWSMRLPMMIAAAGVLGLGLAVQPIVSLLAPIVPY